MSILLVAVLEVLSLRQSKTEMPDGAYEIKESVEDAKWSGDEECEEGEWEGRKEEGTKRGQLSFVRFEG